MTARMCPTAETMTRSQLHWRGRRRRASGRRRRRAPACSRCGRQCLRVGDRPGADEDESRCRRTRRSHAGAARNPIADGSYGEGRTVAFRSLGRGGRQRGPADGRQRVVELPKIAKVGPRPVRSRNVMDLGVVCSGSSSAKPRDDCRRGGAQRGGRSGRRVDDSVSRRSTTIRRPSRAGRRTRSRAAERNRRRAPRRGRPRGPVDPA